MNNVNDKEFETVDGVTNSDRLDPFFAVDLRFQKKIVLKNSILTPYLDIQTASYFIYKSPEMTSWDDFYIDKKIIAMPIIPALGVSWEF